jgi:hypothetical protein
MDAGISALHIGKRVIPTDTQERERILDQE